MAANDTYTQVAPNGSGNKIRNLQVQVLQADGTTATVMMQVVALADAEGNPISVEPDRDLARALMRETRFQSEVLLRILNACEPGEDYDRDTLEMELAEEDDLNAEHLVGVEQ